MSPLSRAVLREGWSGVGPMSRPLRGRHFMGCRSPSVSPPEETSLRRLSFAYFSLARQRKVGAAPHRGDTNKPKANQGKATPQANHPNPKPPTANPKPFLDLLLIKLLPSSRIKLLDILLDKLSHRLPDLPIVGLVKIRKRNPPGWMLRPKPKPRQQHHSRLSRQPEQQLRRLRILEKPVNVI